MWKAITLRGKWTRKVVKKKIRGNHISAYYYYIFVSVCIVNNGGTQVVIIVMA